MKSHRDDYTVADAIAHLDMLYQRSGQKTCIRFMLQGDRLTGDEQGTVQCSA